MWCGLLMVGSVWACTSTSGSSSSGGGTIQDAGGAADAAGNTPDAGGPTPSTETEPNNAATAAEVNALGVPGVMTGTINPADDLDVLRVELTAGAVWRWELMAPGGVVAPHLAITRDGDTTPRLVATGGAGGTAVQEHFVLETGVYFVVVRDARNVPAGSSQHVGSPQHQWRLSAAPLGRAPEGVVFPATVVGTLPCSSCLAAFVFDGTAGTGFDITVRAQRLAPASDLDTRLSLYDVTAADWLITNDDDATANTLDSRVGGMLPSTGGYVAILDNVTVAPGRLDYQVDFSLR